jgi:hypothetical protein
MNNPCVTSTSLLKAEGIQGEMSTILQDANAQAQGSIDLALRKLIGPSNQPMSAIWNQYPGQLAWGDGTQTEYLMPWAAVTSENVDQVTGTSAGALNLPFKTGQKP